MSVSWLPGFGVRAILVLLAAAAWANLEAQTIVYDNTAKPLGSYAGEPGEFGDEVELAGTARTLVDISFEYFAKFTPQGDEMARVRLYSNEKPYDLYRNEPTRVLYESPFFPIETNYNSFTLPGFSTQLPNVVTFIIEFRGLDGPDEAVGLLLYSPATVGRTYNEFWRRNEAGQWQPIIYSLTDPKLKANAALRLRAAETVRMGSVQVTEGREKLRFSLSGLSGTSYTIESSTNLTDWSAVTKRPVTAPTGTFSEAIPADQKFRFYRVRLPIF